MLHEVGHLVVNLIHLNYATTYFTPQPCLYARLFYAILDLSPIANLHSLIYSLPFFGLTPFDWLLSILLSPYL
jgi:hypothetical protein